MHTDKLAINWQTSAQVCFDNMALQNAPRKLCGTCCCFVHYFNLRILNFFRLPRLGLFLSFEQK